MTGRNPTMRWLDRVHRICVAWLHNQFAKENVVLMYEKSDRMAADIYTKAFTDAAMWDKVCGLINVIDPKLIQHIMVKKAKDDAEALVAPTVIEDERAAVAPAQFLAPVAAVAEAQAPAPVAAVRRGARGGVPAVLSGLGCSFAGPVQCCCQWHCDH